MKKLFLSIAFLASSLLAINFNTASKEELMQLKGIGPKKAEAIMQYRKTHKINSVEDLKNIKGFNSKTISKLKEQKTKLKNKIQNKNEKLQKLRKKKAELREKLKQSKGNSKKRAKLQERIKNKKEKIQKVKNRKSELKQKYNEKKSQFKNLKNKF